MRIYVYEYAFGLIFVMFHIIDLILQIHLKILLMSKISEAKLDLPFLICGLLALSSFCFSNTKVMFKFSGKRVKFTEMFISEEILQLLFFGLKNKMVTKFGSNIIKILDDLVMLETRPSKQNLILLTKYLQQFKYYYHRYFSQYPLENFLVYDNKKLNRIALETLFMLIEDFNETYYLQ
jgi:hypothetical protein